MNTLIRRCLAHGVVISPHQQDPVIKMYEEKKIPDDELSLLSRHDLKRYVNALYLCTLEMAGDWSEAYKTLESMGFERKERKDGHRFFVSLVYNQQAKLTVETK